MKEEKPSWRHRVELIKGGILLAGIMPPGERNKLAEAIVNYMHPLMMGATTSFRDAKKALRWWDANVGFKRDLGRRVLRVAHHETKMSFYNDEPHMRLIAMLYELTEGHLPQPVIPGTAPGAEGTGPHTIPRPNAPGSQAKH